MAQAYSYTAAYTSMAGPVEAPTYEGQVPYIGMTPLAHTMHLKPQLDPINAHLSEPKVPPNLDSSPESSTPQPWLSIGRPMKWSVCKKKRHPKSNNAVTWSLPSLSVQNNYKLLDWGVLNVFHDPQTLDSDLWALLKSVSAVSARLFEFE